MILINRKILELAVMDIIRSMGAIDDLPPELANTIANYYYKANEYATGVAEDKMLQGDNDPLQAQLSYSMEAEAILCFIDKIPDMVTAIRTINKFTQPNIYNFATNFAIDALKYNIPNVEKKSGLRRILERPFRKLKLSEIPNLMEYVPIDIESTNVNANEVINKGKSLIAVNDWQRAILTFNTLLNEDSHKKDSRYAVAYHFRGYAYAQLKNHQQALYNFNKATELHPSYADAYYHSAFAYNALKNYSMANQNLKMAAKLGNKHAQQYFSSKGIEWQ